jgi:hypothetical protein
MAVISGGVIISGGNVNGIGAQGGAPFSWGAAPTSGGSGTYVGKAVAGSRLVRTDTGQQYIATAVTTASSVTWTEVAIPA